MPTSDAPTRERRVVDPAAPDPSTSTPDVLAVTESHGAPDGLSGTTAATVLSALRGVVKSFERLTIPADPQAANAWRSAAPAPRHVSALLQIVTAEPISVTALAAALGVSLATASQVVTDLENAELAERVEDPTDRRRTLVRIAAAQRGLISSIIDTRLRPVQRALARMEPAEQKALIRGLELIAEEVRKTTTDA